MILVVTVVTRDRTFLLFLFFFFSFLLGDEHLVENLAILNFQLYVQFLFFLFLCKISKFSRDVWLESLFNCRCVLVD